MQVISHLLFARDLIGLVDHIVDDTGGDFGAAGKRLDNADQLISNILASPFSGVSPLAPLNDRFVCHGGRGYRLTVCSRQI